VTEVFLNLAEVFLTLTEVFPCFFLSCKANARVKLAKTGHDPHSSTLVVICVVMLLFVLFSVLFVCKCVLYYCHRVTTQLQLINISYHIMSKTTVRRVLLKRLPRDLADLKARIIGGVKNIDALMLTRVW